MIDPLSALSLYRQLEGLEETLKHAAGSPRDTFVNQFLSALHSQDAFNHILSEITEQCADSPQYLRSFSHIKPVNIPRGADRSAYPRFFAQVQMLKQAVRALLELAFTPEEKQKIGFV